MVSVFAQKYAERPNALPVLALSALPEYAQPLATARAHNNFVKKLFFSSYRLWGTWFDVPVLGTRLCCVSVYQYQALSGRQTFMKNSPTTHHEYSFAENEILYSRTTPKGVILEVNDNFVPISGFS